MYVPVNDPLSNKGSDMNMYMHALEVIVPETSHGKQSTFEPISFMTIC